MMLHDENSCQLPFTNQLVEHDEKWSKCNITFPRISTYIGIHRGAVKILYKFFFSKEKFITVLYERIFSAKQSGKKILS